MFLIYHVLCRLECATPTSTANPCVLLTGAAPHDFAEGDLYVNALTPVSCLCCTCYFLKEVINCKVLSIFCGATTDNNYNQNFRFCEPQSSPQPGPESLSSILFVDRIFNSPYDVRTSTINLMTSLTLSFTVDMLKDNGTCQNDYASSRAIPVQKQNLSMIESVEIMPLTGLLTAFLRRNYPQLGCHKPMPADQVCR